MQEEQTRNNTSPEEPRRRDDHPWLEMSQETGPDEVIRYSLDEIRFR